jgi:predicted nuclease with TOPRIM domain
MNTQIEFDEDNKTFGFDEWEYLNFRNRTQLGEDANNILEKLLCIQKELDQSITKIPEEVKLLKTKIASLNGKLSAAKTSHKKLQYRYLCLHNEYQSIKHYILSDCPGFLIWNDTTTRIKARYQELKNELEILKKEGLKKRRIFPAVIEGGTG